jgi:hypothetical protein
MKVICTTPIILTQPGYELYARPKVGDEDIVLYECQTAEGTYYILERFGEDVMFHSKHFSTMPDSTNDEIEAGEQEAIVPNPACEEKAVAAYQSVYAVTGCELRACDAYFETLQNHQA